MIKSIFEELDEIYNDELNEANNNWSSNKAKNALVTKYLKNELCVDPNKENIRDYKEICILHHLNGDYNNDKNLENDVLIIANSKEDAKLAHKIIHLLSYCYIRDELEDRLKKLGVKFYYNPDTTGKAQDIDVRTIAGNLAEHNKNLKDIALIDQDEEDLDSLGINNFRINK